ncbi:MAG: hypothetical protein R3F34_20985, partial [Planctomycetota bacterium]
GPESYGAERGRPRVRVSAAEIGADEVQPVVDATPSVFDRRPVLGHRVWIETEQGDALLGPVTVDTVSGGTVEVDLRRDVLLERLGTVRIHVDVDEEVFAPLSGDYRVDVLKADPEHPARPWTWVASGVPRDPDSKGRDHVATGLEPGRCRVVVRPLSAFADVDVPAGGEIDVTIDMRDLGSVRFRAPEGESLVGGRASVADPEFSDFSRWTSWTLLRGHEDDARLLLAGSYAGRVGFFLSDRKVAFVSDPFVVRSGETTAVDLRATPVMTFDVVVRHAETGEVLAFDVAFWVNFVFRSAETGRRVVGPMSFEESGGACTGIEFSVDGPDGDLRLEVPESPFFTFDEVEPFVVEDGGTVTVHARPKN